MQILHVISSLDPSTGGPPRVAVRLAAGQSALGHRVSIATYALQERDDFHNMTRSLPHFQHIHLVEIVAGGLLEDVFGGRARALMRPLIQQADIVHIHNIWTSINRVAADEAYRAGKPYVIQSNDMLTPWSLSQNRLKKRLALGMGYRKMIERSMVLLFGHAEERRLTETAGFKTLHIVTSLGSVFQQEVD